MAFPYLYIRIIYYMEEKLVLAKKEIDLQISKIEKILDKREVSGQHFEDFMSEEKARLFGMLQIFWLIGGAGYDQFKK
jgi:hypothetical protein